MSTASVTSYQAESIGGDALAAPRAEVRLSQTVFFHDPETNALKEYVVRVIIPNTNQGSITEDVAKKINTNIRQALVQFVDAHNDAVMTYKDQLSGMSPFRADFQGVHHFKQSAEPLVVNNSPEAAGRWRAIESVVASALHCPTPLTREALDALPGRETKIPDAEALSIASSRPSEHRLFDSQNTAEVVRQATEVREKELRNKSQTASSPSLPGSMHLEFSTPEDDALRGKNEIATRAFSIYTDGRDQGALLDNVIKYHNYATASFKLFRTKVTLTNDEMTFYKGYKIHLELREGQKLSNTEYKTQLTDLLERTK